MTLISHRTVPNGTLFMLRSIPVAVDGSGRRYGVSKIWHDLRRDGHGIARCTVERLMKVMEIQGVVRGQRVSDLLCMSNMAHASLTKEHDTNDDFQGRFRRATEWR